MFLRQTVVFRTTCRVCGHNLYVSAFYSVSASFCQDLYTEIVQAENGRAIWTYMKPLLRGMVLYTPQTDTTTAIMTKVELIKE